MLSLNDPLEKLYRSKVPKAITSLKTAGILTVEDFIWTFPSKILTSTTFHQFEDLVPGENYLLKATVIAVKSQRLYQRNSPRLKIDARLQTEKGKILFATWFQSFPSMETKLKTLSAPAFFYGRIQSFSGQFGFTNPQLIELKDGEKLTLYPKFQGVGSSFFKKLMSKVREKVIIPSGPQKYNHNLNEAIETLHASTDSHKRKLAMKRVIYEEFYRFHFLNDSKRKDTFLPESSTSIDSELLEAHIKKLEFTLTQGQKLAVEEIIKDARSPYPLNRILQGDVGSGKTIVAFLIGTSINSNTQSVFMFPTETLAKQQFQNFKKIFPQYSKVVGFISGSSKTKEKKEFLKKVKDNEIRFIFGTHSLIQDQVVFHNLQFSVIDEQHKFGVNQRNTLKLKSTKPNILMMSATPIPRSLAMVQYGDMDVTTIKERPAFQKEIKTRLVTKKNYQNYLSFLLTRLELNEQIYVVAPSIEDSEELKMRSVTSIFEEYSKYFQNYKIELLHGKLKAEEKDAVMKRFSSRETKVLVSTTVIEVGINNPNATVMAIIDPQRFGMSTLHQLRGRVGRGSLPGFCFLVPQSPMGKESFSRLLFLEKNTDGFLIAEEDLKNRGEGDITGTIQSGHKKFRYAQISEHSDILSEAYQDIYEKKWPKYNESLGKLLKDMKFLSTI